MCFKLPNDVVYIVSQDNYINDKNIRRVTDILSEISVPEIIEWANVLGFQRKRYKQELNKYAVIGTKVHNEIEEIIDNNINSPFYLLHFETTGAYAFYTWLDYRRSKGDRLRVIAKELSLRGNYFAGTLDCLMDINGETYLIDFKTSNTIGYKYFMQLCAYKYLLDVYGFEKSIDKLMILQVSKTNPDSFNEYILDCHNDKYMVDEYTKAFLDLVLLSNRLDTIRGFGNHKI